MTANLIDLHQPAQSGKATIQRLHECLLPLVGEPFQLLRVSYGDEVTLHLGPLRAARSPKVKHQYGSYIISLRASSWIAKSTVGKVLFSLSESTHPAAVFGDEMTNAELEAQPLIQPGSLLLSALPFLIREPESIGLQLHWSDGSTIFIQPNNEVEFSPPQPEDLPAIADWEVTMPAGHLSVGPGPHWEYVPERTTTTP
jgi:hypothetical protein